MTFQKGNKLGKKFSKENQPEENGRKPKIPALDILLGEVVGEDGMKEIIQAMQKEAKKGNVQAANCILDRQFGKAKQQIDLKQETTGELNVVVHREIINGKNDDSITA